MWSHTIFACLLSVIIATALSTPERLKWLNVNVHYTLALACFSVGISTRLKKVKDLLGSKLGLGNFVFSFFIGTFLWPALGLAASVLALQQGLPFAAVVGLALLAACPVGGPSAAINVHAAGGSLECSALLCLLSTPAALITFPCAFRAFSLLLLDQPTHAPLSASAAQHAADAAAMRAELSASLDGLSSAVQDTIRTHALYITVLPLAAGAVLSAVLPARTAGAARAAGPWVAGAMVTLTAAATARSMSYGSRVLWGHDGMRVAAAVAVLHGAAMAVGALMPAGVGSPSWTCRTTAFQASTRNPSLGLALASALFRTSPHLALLATPCALSILTQNLLAAWAAAAWRALAPPAAAAVLRPPHVGLRGGLRVGVQGAAQAGVRRSASGGAAGAQLSPRAFQAQSLDAILRRETCRKLAVPPTPDKED